MGGWNGCWWWVSGREAHDSQRQRLASRLYFWDTHACLRSSFIHCLRVAGITVLVAITVYIFFSANPEGVNPSTRKCWKLSLN